MVVRSEKHCTLIFKLDIGSPKHELPIFVFGSLQSKTGPEYSEMNINGKSFGIRFSCSTFSAEPAAKNRDLFLCCMQKLER